MVGGSGQRGVGTAPRSRVLDCIALFLTAALVVLVIGFLFFVVEWVKFFSHELATVLMLSAYFGLSTVSAFAVAYDSTACGACRRHLRRRIAPRMLLAFLVLVPVSVWAVGTLYIAYLGKASGWFSEFIGIGLSAAPVVALAMLWVTGSPRSAAISAFGVVTTVLVVSVIWIFSFPILGLSFIASLIFLRCTHVGK